MAKLFLVILSAGLIGVLAEPPPSYLPPQARNSLSSRYGAPQQGPASRYNAPAAGGRFNGNGARGSFSYNSIAENQFGGFQRSNGRSNGRSRLNGQNGFGAPSNGFAAPSNGFAAPSNGFAAPSNGFSNGARRNGFNGQSSPVSSYSAPRSLNGAGSSYNAPSQQYGAPSQQYGAPQARTPSSEYGAPLGKSLMDDDLAEPANYEFNYEVQALEESGPEFGHQESREEDSARGEYHVLLPDGRMQIVEYEADEEGFRPRIRYEETGLYPEARNGNGLDNQGPY